MLDKKFTSVSFLQQVIHKPLEQMDLYYSCLIIFVCFKVVPIVLGGFFVSPNISGRSRRLQVVIFWMINNSTNYLKHV